MAYEGKVNVWAPRWGKWKKGNGYDYIIPFRSLESLVDELKSNGLQGKVNRLAIMTHGDVRGSDSGGIVQMESDNDASASELKSSTLPKYQPYFKKLRLYLTNPGILGFFGCGCARGQEGDAFLRAISELLPGRTIVGFTHILIKTGEAGYSQQIAGQLKSTGTPSQLFLEKEAAYKETLRLTIHDDKAKWAKNGAVYKQAKGDSGTGPSTRRRSAKLDPKLWKAALLFKKNPSKLIPMISEREKRGEKWKFPAYCNEKLWALYFKMQKASGRGHSSLGRQYSDELRQWESKGIHYYFDEKEFKKDGIALP